MITGSPSVLCYSTASCCRWPSIIPKASRVSSEDFKMNEAFEKISGTSASEKQICYLYRRQKYFSCSDPVLVINVHHQAANRRDRIKGTTEQGTKGIAGIIYEIWIRPSCSSSQLETGVVLVRRYWSTLEMGHDKIAKLTGFALPCRFLSVPQGAEHSSPG